MPSTAARFWVVSVTVGLTTALVGSLALKDTSARAAVPTAGAPLAGAIRRKVGNFEITALLDGYLDVNGEMVIGYDEVTARDLRTRHFTDRNQIRIPINAYLVNTGGKLILIDAGSADALGPTAGHLEAPLRAAGVTPEQIDAILITHMHPDHIKGVLTPEGAKAYANAELILPETEHAFWFDDANLNAAPEGGERVLPCRASGGRRVQGPPDAVLGKCGDRTRTEVARSSGDTRPVIPGMSLTAMVRR